MLSVNNLSVNYGSTRVVDKLNLELGQDEILMLVGPTGCGKTNYFASVGWAYSYFRRCDEPR